MDEIVTAVDMEQYGAHVRFVGNNQLEQIPFSCCV